MYPGDGFVRDAPGVHVLPGVPGNSVQLVAPSANMPGIHPGIGSLPHPADIQPVNKRPRMDARDSNLGPLRIETRESSKEPGYHPQVEAISPTPEDRPAERDDVRSTKDDLLQKIAKVDREIAKAESQIAKLKKKQQDLEDAANRPTSDSATEDEKPANQSIAQVVYSENRRKADKSHATLEKLAGNNDLPLYNQPSDTAVYNQNKRNYTAFKKKLVEYFKKKNDDKEARDRYFTHTYCKLTSIWTKKVDRIEKSRKRIEKEGKSREMYEKIFPELRKQREDKERDQRLGTRGAVRSEADMEDVIERLQEQEENLNLENTGLMQTNPYPQMEDKKMHAYAVIPPPLLPPEDRKRKFTNNNGLIQDPLLIYNERKFINMWTGPEKDIFQEKYLQHPKNFGLIAQYLERKTVSDCVQYYYLSKKTENYKQLLRKSRQRSRGTRRGTAAPTGEVIAPNVTGVVTRRTVQDLQKGEANSEALRGSRSNTPQPSTPIKVEQENGETDSQNEKEGKGKERSREKKSEAANESSDEDEGFQAVKGGPHPCVLCKLMVDHSRPVQKSQAGLLGVKEEELSAESRVCNNCWCKTIRRKHAHCPLPSCTTSKGKVKGRLRHLPSKLSDLPKPTKDAIYSEFQISEGMKKCCTTCFTRLSRRISEVAGIENAGKPEPIDVPWTEDDIELAKQCLLQHGPDWKKMADKISSKVEDQCKKFFYRERKKLSLDKLVQEFKKVRANLPEGSAKPTLTSDEEESGSSTSSCEDEPMKVPGEENAMEGAANENSTDKSKGDLKPPAPNPAEVKPEAKPEEVPAVGAAPRPAKPEEDYDSSATMSADEGATADPANGARPQQPAQIRGRAPAVAPPPPAPQGVPGVATPPGGGPRADMLTVKDLMTTVIEHSLHQPNVTTAPATTAPPVIPAPVKKPDVSNLHHMLQVAGPSPHQTNYVRNNLGKGGKVIPRPDLEVRPVAPGTMAPPQVVPNAAPAGAATAAPAVDEGVLNLTVPTRRERSPPHQAVALGPRDQYRDPNTAPRPTLQDQRGTPPPAHGGTKTTHARIMNQTYEIYRDPYRPDNRSPAPNSEQQRNRSASVHSPGPSLVVRGDPREHVRGLKTGGSSNSLPPPLHPNKPAGLSITPGGRSGSIVTGTPVSQHSPRYDTMLQPSGDKPPSHGGSITRGIPVYPDRRHPTNMMPEPGRASLPGAGAEYHKRNSSPAYPQYQGQRPASHDPSQPRSSVRSVIENDFRTAKTLSRPDGREDYPRGHPSSHSRAVDHHRGLPDPRAPIVGDPRVPVELGRSDPRLPDGRPIYSDPRIPMSRESHVGDPRADIPGRHEARDMRPEVRGDPRNELRPELRMDPREQQMRQDPRAAELSRIAASRGDTRALDRASPYYPNPAMYERMQVQAGQRERRTPPSSRPQVIQPSVSQQQQQPPQRGSLTSGQPIKRPNPHVNQQQQQQQQPPHRDPVDIYRQHPEVSITKQPSAGPSHVPISRHGEYGLDALVNVAVQQPKLPEGKDRQSSSSMLPLRDPGTSRGPPQDPGNRGGGRFAEKRPYDHRQPPQQQQQPDPRAFAHNQTGQVRMQAAVDLERQRQQLMLQLNQMSEADRLRLLDDQRRAAMEKGMPGHAGGDPRTENNTLTAANLIDIIITHQINQGAVPGGDKSRNSPQTLADGKDSPCKPPSRSPSVKSINERDVEDGGGSRPGSTAGPQVRTSPGTVGEHIESMINKEVSVSAARDNRTSPFPVTSQADASHEHWKRRPAYHNDQATHTQPRPPSHPSQGSIPRPNSGMGQLVSDERQIIRVAQNTSPGARPDKPPSRPNVEPISPPNSMGPAATLYYQGGDPNVRGAQNMDAMSRFLAAQQRQVRQDEAAKAQGGANLSPFDYVKHKIAEVMKKGEGGGPSDVAKSSHMLLNQQVPMGPPHKRPHTESETRGSPTTGGEGGSNPESPRKRYKGDVDGVREEMPDSPGSGEMVIDESARPDSAHSHKTSSPAPNVNDPNHYRPPPPTRASPSMQPPRTSQPSTVPLARYEPLSDDD